MTEAIAERSRARHLDGLRGLAALLVTLHHGALAFDAALYTGDPTQAHAGWEASLAGLPLLGLPIAGNFAVHLFFVLSGIVLAEAFAASPLGPVALLAKRAVRLGLPMLAAALLGWVVLAAGWATNLAAAPLTLSPWLAAKLRQAPSLFDALAEPAWRLLLAPWRTEFSYNSNLWTMPTELAGSALLVLLCAALRPWLARPAGRRAAALLLLGLGLLAGRWYISLFCFGAALHWAAAGRWLGRWPAAGWASLGLGLLLGALPYAPGPGGWAAAIAGLAPWGAAPPPTREWLLFRMLDPVSWWHGVGAVLLLAGVQALPGVQRALAMAGPCWLGTLSFPLYLVHLPVLFSLGCGLMLGLSRLGLSYGAAAGLAFAAYLLAALALARLAVPLLERPALALAARAGRALSGSPPASRSPAPPPR